MNVTLLRYTPNPDEICGEAAAICAASDDYTSALCGALACGHESVAEHAAFTFKIEGVSRALLSQLTRHRLASFSVESQRYVGIGALEAVMPQSIAENQVLLDAYKDLMSDLEGFYHKAVALGVPKEDARYILPLATCTRLVMTMNARELLHFFELRCCNRSQWEIRALADRMLEHCRLVAPGIFSRAGCACMQGKCCPEGKKSCGYPRKLIKNERGE